MKSKFRKSFIAAVFGTGLTWGQASNAPLQVTANTRVACAGHRVHLVANRPVRWAIDTPSAGWILPVQSSSTDAYYTPAIPPPASNSAGAAPASGAAGASGAVATPLPDDTATISAKDGSTEVKVDIRVTGGCLGGEIVRAVVGFEQIGASGTPSNQDFLFDFFISRPVPIPFGGHNGNPIGSDATRLWGPKLRLWGNVKIDSYPQQVNSSLTQLSSQFATTFGNLKVNQLAESAEFVAGPEFRVGSFSWPLQSPTDPSAAQRFALMLFAGAGAIGPNNPTDNATVFQIPAAGSPNLQTLQQQVQQLGGQLPTGATNIAFVPQSSTRFLQQYEGGLRLYTFYSNPTTGSPYSTPPATFEFSVGQNQFVTGGRLSGLVGHVAAMYPFSMGPRNSSSSVVLYLFGESTTAYKRAEFNTPLTLAPAITNGTPVALSDASVYTLTVPGNRRDTYRIGVGLDLVSVWKALNKPATNPTTGNQPQPAATNGGANPKPAAQQ
jgi:hypothetical protein